MNVGVDSKIGLVLIMISGCRKCGKLVEMTTEEAFTPIWCCNELDRLCVECFEKMKIHNVDMIHL